MEQAKREQLLLGKGGLYGNVLRIAPPMLIDNDDIDDGLARLACAMARV
jgi:4-aminobutyrate aminotransferase